MPRERESEIECWVSIRCRAHSVIAMNEREWTPNEIKTHHYEPGSPCTYRSGNS